MYAAPGASPGDRVHPLVLRAAADEPVEFIVFLEEQADSRSAARAAGPLDRAANVARTLREVARRTQAPLIAVLEEREAEYRSFWIANMIWVRSTRATAEFLAARADVRRIDANPRVKGVAPDLPHAQPKAGGAIEHGIAHVGADAVWNLGYSGQGVIVGGQDTGYSWDHPAIVRQYRGWDGLAADHAYNWHDAIHASLGPCPGDSPAPCDDHSHGTHTMGTMVGDDGGSNRIGMAPGARWIGCRNMDQGSGTPATYSECFEWFLAPTDADGLNPDPSRAPHVINNSWACPSFEGCSVDTLRTVVENARAAGIVVVVSAGNSGDGCSTIDDPPAVYDASFTVGATDNADVSAGFSSRGPVLADGSGRLKPDISAPGVGVRSAVLDGQYAAYSGTSMAGPHVAGLVALLLSARPDLKGRVDEIEELIVRSAVSLQTTDACGGDEGTTVPNHTYGHGRIDALALLTGDPDGDRVDNLADCAPLSPDAWSIPGTATDLRLSAGADTLLQWSAPLNPGGAAPAYEVLRSGRADSFAEATCLEPSPAGTSASDPSTPTALFAYLVRATNACGSALGPASNGVPRSAPACP